MGHESGAGIEHQQGGGPRLRDASERPDNACDVGAVRGNAGAGIEDVPEALTVAFDGAPVPAGDGEGGIAELHDRRPGPSGPESDAPAVRLRVRGADGPDAAGAAVDEGGADALL